MTDQFINNKRAILLLLRSEYRGISKNLKTIREVFKNKVINEMIDAGLIHVLCDHKHTTITATHQGEKNTIYCVSCDQELFNMAGILLNEKEYRLTNQIEYRNKDIFGGYGGTFRDDIKILEQKRNELGGQYVKVKEEIGAHVVEGLRKVGFINQCKHPGVTETDKKCAKCSQYVWIKQFGSWLSSDNYNTVQNTVQMIPEFDVVQQTDRIDSIFKEDQE